MKNFLVTVTVFITIGISQIPAQGTMAGDCNYPKENQKIRLMMNIPAEELKERKDIRFHVNDSLWRENAEIQEKDLLNLHYAAVVNTAYRDWACNARGNIVVFVEDDEFGCIYTHMHVFKKIGNTFKRIGYYSFVSRHLIPESEKLHIEDDGITFTGTCFWGNGCKVSASHKFYFSSPKEIYGIFLEKEHYPILKGRIITEKELKFLHDFAFPL